MLAYIRRTPFGFWLALVGVGFFLWVFLSRFWQEESGFALTLILAYLLVALLTAIHKRGTWLAAFWVGTFTAVVEVGLVLLFSGLFPPQPAILAVAISHAIGAFIAAAAGASAGVAAIRSTPRPTGQVGATPRAS